jgi:hypothetical protein
MSNRHCIIVLPVDSGHLEIGLGSERQFSLELTGSEADIWGIFLPVGLFPVKDGVVLAPHITESQ